MIKQDYTYSLDIDSNLINVNDAEKGHNYYCPCCGAIMIPRQGNKRRWHFAHKGNLGECSYETYLHKIAKRQICECFNNSPQFTITFYSKTTCAISECPLGTKNNCTWDSTKEFNLKQYYNQCKEEITIDKYRADLVIFNNQANIPPVLVEIYVTHKSTEEKLNSSYRIIEIHIESEDDINQIVSTASIIESDRSNRDIFWKEKSNDKIRFYNFKADTYELPDNKHQAYKFRFWIDPRGYFHFDSPEEYYESIKCLSPNPTDIEYSTFLIESKAPIRWDFAFCKLAESGLGIKYCTMCKFYKMNVYYMRSMCILYKSKGTTQYPMLSNAMNCPHFKQIDYVHDNKIFAIDYNQEYKITIR